MKHNKEYATLKEELLQIIEKLNDYQIRMVLSFVKTLFTF